MYTVRVERDGGREELFAKLSQVQLQPRDGSRPGQSPLLQTQAQSCEATLSQRYIHQSGKPSNQLNIENWQPVK